MATKLMNEILVVFYKGGEVVHRHTFQGDALTTESLERVEQSVADKFQVTKDQITSFVSFLVPAENAEQLVLEMDGVIREGLGLGEMQ